MSVTDLEPLELEAHPTKALFVDLLTRDVNLADAVAELVDNSVDGARRVRGADGDFTGLYVRVQMSQGSFTVEDNCGGISWHIAKHQLFRLGRPKEAELVPGSVGRFGIGLKRAVFKMGLWFKVTTTSPKDHYSVTVDVEKWSASDAPESWVLEADALPEHPTNGRYPEDDLGTTIEVERLYPTVASQFADESFVRGVQNAVRERQGNAISRGLAILVNGATLVDEKYRLIDAGPVRPAWTEKQINGTAPDVDFRCITGVARPGDSDSSGWYVICNGRTIVRADRTSLLGWNELEHRIPRFHKEYAPFRGYAFFDCPDPDRLPWNTSKTGLNEESAVFQEARPVMVEAMKPVIGYLREAYKAMDEGGPSPVKVLRQYSDRPIDDIDRTGSFEYDPPTPEDAGESLQRISFQKPSDIAEVVKSTLEAGSWKEVGELLFDYYVGYEIEE